MCRMKKSIKLFVFFSCLLVLFLSPFLSFAEGEKDLLDMTLEELMNVKITTAARTPEKIGDIPASVVLITRKEIETYGYRTLAEILENIPGLYGINDYGEEGVNFGVRGFWSGVPNDNMIILVNNNTTVSDFQSNYPLTKIPIPVEAIDRIEVIRGPMSVIYGNGAFYGVINIFTNDFSKNVSPEENKNDSVDLVSTSVGSAQTKKLFIRSAGKKKHFGYAFNATIYGSYGLEQPLNEMVSDPGILPLFGITEGVNDTTGGRLENDEKYFNFSGTFKSFYVDLSYNESNNEFYYLLPSFSKGNQNFNASTNISFGFKKKFSDKLTLDGKFNYTENRHVQKYDFFSPDFFGNQKASSNAALAELNAFFHPSKNLDITAGLHYRSILNVSTTYDLPSFGDPTLLNNYLFLSDNSDIITRAFFAQVNLKPLSNFSLVAGIRFEQMPKYNMAAMLISGTPGFKKVEAVYDQDEIEIIPRFAAIYSLNDKHFFKLLYGKAINRPSFFQNSQKLLLGPDQGFLKPENIQTLEFNYIASISANFTLNVSIFRNTLDNLITRVSDLDDEGNYQTWSANAGTMVTQGTELTINAEPLKNFRMELSGTFQKTEDQRDNYKDIEVAYSPKLLGYLKASYRIKGFALSVTGNYVGAMETFWDETRIDPDHPFGQRIGDRVDGYFLLGANLRIENFLYKGLYLNIRCSNLLDKQIRYPTYTNNDLWATRGTLGFGRTFLVSLGLKF